MVNRVLTRALIAGAIVFCTGVAVITYAARHNLDAINALVMLFDEPQGETVPPDQISYHQPKTVRWLGNVQNPKLSEISGLASSTDGAPVLWAVNDSGNMPNIYALSVSGQHLGSWPTTIPLPGDWEALASFIYDGKGYLLVGDVGDNFRWRTSLRLFVLPEPDYNKPVSGEAVKIAWWFRFRYPDGFRDCEALAVDEATQEIILIAKRVIPAEVYSVPLKPEQASAPGEDAVIVTARHLADLGRIPQPTPADLREDPNYGHYRSRPTGLSIMGHRAVVTTYHDAYLFERQHLESWGNTFARSPKRIALPRVSQREAGALSRDGFAFYTTTERANGTDAAGVYQVDL